MLFYLIYEMNQTRHTWSWRADKIIIFHDTAIFLINSPDNLSRGARGGSTGTEEEGKNAAPPLSRALMGTYYCSIEVH